MLYRLFRCVLLLLLLQSCYNTPDSLKPGAWVFKQVPKDAPPIFKQAWIDGCKTGLASMSNSYYKSFYRFTQNPVLRKNPTYYKTWVDTYNFCRHYIYGTLREADVRMKLPEAPNNCLDNLTCSEGIMDKGILSNRGPGTEGLLLENWGYTGGGDWFLDSTGGELDYSDDMILNGKSNPVMDWDFTGGMHSIIPY